MSDLISRKAVLEKLAEWSDRLDCENSKQFTLAEFEVVISKMETAYDTEKVVEKIEGLRHPYTSFEDGTGCLHEYDFYIESAKDIVRGGGIDE